MTAKFELYRDNRNEYRWRFRAKNGLIIAVASESYKKRSDCLHGIDLVKTEGPTAPVDDLT